MLRKMQHFYELFCLCSICSYILNSSYNRAGNLCVLKIAVLEISQTFETWKIALNLDEILE